MANWEEQETEKLKLHYTQFNMPSDQIIKDKDVLGNFTQLFNTKFTPNNDFEAKQVADQLLKLRKSGKLPRIRN